MIRTIDDYINQPLEIKNDLLSFFKIDDNLILFDIGACEGEESIKYSNLFPNASIYAFEPMPSNYAIAKNNLSVYKKDNVKISQTALSDKDGFSDFYISSGAPDHLKNDENWNYGNKSSSLLEPGDATDKYYSWLKFDNKVSVKTQRISSFVIENSINYIDFAHIDVQGATLMVLKGAENFIENIKIIYTEVEAVDLYKNQPLKQEIELFMKSKGFYLYFDKVGKITGDQFYVNKRFFSKKRNLVNVISSWFS